VRPAALAGILRLTLKGATDARRRRSSPNSAGHLRIINDATATVFFTDTASSLPSALTREGAHRPLFAYVGKIW